jgi:VanZ family protein
MHRYKSAALPLALLYAALIVYASLFPFSGWRDQGIAPWSYLDAPWPQYWTRFDLVSNLVGYMPLGFLLTLSMLWPARRPWLAALLAALGAAALSFTMEALQSYLPARVASNVDLGFNAAGGLLGALVAAGLERLGAVERWRRLRARWFVRDSRGALVLLALWPVGLLFPAPVAFGLGQVYERLEEGLASLLADTPFLEWLPLRELDLQPLLPGVELVCVALGALVPCLLGYTVMRHRGRRLLFAAMALITGVLVSALSAGLSYGPIHAWAWISAPVELGLLVAVFMAALTVLLPGRVCVALLIAVLVAQVALLNAAPESAYFSLTLQNWEQGRFIHFNGLAQWIGWLWPYVTVVYLLGRVGRSDGGQPEPALASGPAMRASTAITATPAHLAAGGDPAGQSHATTEPPASPGPSAGFADKADEPGWVPPMVSDSTPTMDELAVTPRVPEAPPKIRP